MDPITAVAAAAALLAAKGSLEAVGTQAGQSAWGGAARLVARLRDRFRGDPDAEAALELATQRPDDDRACEDLARTLDAYMLGDGDFAADIRRMVDEAVAGQSSGSRGSVHAAVIKNATVFNGKVTFEGGLNQS